jgi:hypothetical protein
MTHTITANHEVHTFGTQGQPVAVTRWPDHNTAMAYAQRMASFVGGTVVDESALVTA